jgi:hypothetical protein
MANLPPNVTVSPAAGKVIIRLANISQTYSVAEARAIASAILTAASAAPTQQHLAIHGGLAAPQRPRWEDMPKSPATVEVSGQDEGSTETKTEENAA